MGTRAIIVFQGNFDPVMLYRHCDGYPETVLPDLKEFIEKIQKEELMQGFSKKNSSRLALAFMENYLDDYQPTGRINSMIDYIYFVISTFESDRINIITKELKYL